VGRLLSITSFSSSEVPAAQRLTL